jgi:hypothetical protein
LSSYDGAVVAGAALVKAGANGVLTALPSSGTHLVLDINGFFQ